MGRRNENLRRVSETDQGGCVRDRQRAGALVANLDVKLESGQVLGPMVRPAMLGSRGDVCRGGDL